MNEPRKQPVLEAREVKYLESIRPLLEEAVETKGAPAELIQFKVMLPKSNPNAGYTSVYFKTFTVFRVRFRRGAHYILIPVLFQDMIPAGFKTKQIASDPLYIRLPVDSEHPAEIYTEFLVRIAGETVNRYPKEWDCCSRYMECSDAKKCVHPDKVFALDCGYRKILDSGRIFYGDNRNVE